jgi:hypothetical protein
MIIFGGRNENYLNDMFEYDFVTNFWKKILFKKEKIPIGRYGHTSGNIII